MTVVEFIPLADVVATAPPSTVFPTLKFLLTMVVLLPNAAGVTFFGDAIKVRLRHMMYRKDLHCVDCLEMVYECCAVDILQVFC